MFLGWHNGGRLLCAAKATYLLLDGLIERYKRMLVLLFRSRQTAAIIQEGCLLLRKLPLAKRLSLRVSVQPVVVALFGCARERRLAFFKKPGIFELYILS